MNTWLLTLTWICLTTKCRSDDTDIRTMDRRLLLNDPNTLLNHIEALQRDLTSLKSQVTSQQTEINAMQNQLVKRNPGTGSVYTVWGRKSCPAVNGTTTVYTGLAGGNEYYIHGGGVNTLCLTHNPDDAPHDFPTRQDGSSRIHGSEYQFNYRKFAQDDDVPCAVCHVGSTTSILMIPSKSTCPNGWNIQYNGFLVSNHNSASYSPFDYICLHNDAEYLTEGARLHNMNGHILYPVQATCGSLPCPPYKQDQYITCAVCSL
uniref:Short-chain collagen C4-like n=1 Tax=Crassostrea virginica TaxID=6565 RepID=A0A8B8BKF5_CRAVI|nr:short-chain collagen C4-like [Crassostrea virginica]